MISTGARWSPSAIAAYAIPAVLSTVSAAVLVRVPGSTITALAVMVVAAIVVGALVVTKAPIFVLMLGAVALLPLTTVRALGSLGNVSDAVFLLVFALAVVANLQQLGRLFDISVVGAPLLVFATGGLVAVAHAVAGVSSLLVLAKIAFALWLLPNLVAVTCSTNERLRVVAIVFAVAAAVSAAAAGSDALLGTGWQQAVTGTVPKAGRYSGLMGHPNDLGIFSALGITAVLALYLSSRSAARFATYTLLGLACALGLLTSGSLSGVAASVAGVSAVLVMNRHRFRPSRLAGLAACTVAIVAMVNASGAGGHSVLFARISSNPLNAPTLQTRDTTNWWGIHRIETDPVIGHGLDQVGTGPTHPPELPAIHNLWIQTWYVAGILGFVGMIWFYVRIWKLGAEIPEAASSLWFPLIVVWLVGMLANPDIYSRFGLVGVIGALAAKRLSVMGSTDGSNVD